MNLIFFPRTALSSACMAAWVNSVRSKTDVQRIFIVLDLNNDFYFNRLITIYWKDLKTEILYLRYPTPENVYKYNFDFTNLFKSVKKLKQNYHIEFTRIQDELKCLEGIPFKYLCFTNSFPIEMFMKILSVQDCLYFEHGSGDLIQRKIDSQMYKRLTYLIRSIFEVIFLNQYKLYRPNIHFFSIFSEFVQNLPKNVHQISHTSLSKLFKSGTNVIASEISDMLSKKYSLDFDSMIIIPNLPVTGSSQFYNFIADTLKLADSCTSGDNILIKLSSDQFREQLSGFRYVLSGSTFLNKFVILDDEKMNKITAEHLCVIFSVSTIFSVGRTTTLFLRFIGHEVRFISLVPIYEYQFTANGDLSDNKQVKADIREFNNFKKFLIN
jgi:hypothetical protein